MAVPIDLVQPIEFALSTKRGVLWHVFIAPIEAILDRIEEAVRTGQMPTIIRRKMAWPAAASFALLSFVL